MFMNEYEIQESLDIVKNHAPDIVPYAQYLQDWVDIINQNSDGWAFWRAGRAAGDKLGNAVQKAVNALRGRGEMPTEKELKAGLTPIKSAATRHNLPVPEFKEAAATPAPGV